MSDAMKITITIENPSPEILRALLGEPGAKIGIKPLEKGDLPDARELLERPAAPSPEKTASVAPEEGDVVCYYSEAQGKDRYGTVEHVYRHRGGKPETYSVRRITHGSKVAAPRIVEKRHVRRVLSETERARALSSLSI